VKSNNIPSHNGGGMWHVHVRKYIVARLAIVAVNNGGNNNNVMSAA